MSSPATNQRLLTYVDALREAVAQEMQRDPRVFVFGLDVDDHKAIQGSTRGLVDDFGPERVFGTPLSEDAMTGVAIGAAMAGMRPIHVHIRMDFLMLCMNRSSTSPPRAATCTTARSGADGGCSMIGKSWGQGAQHSQGLHAMFMHVPGLKVVAPSNAYDAKGCLIAAIRDDNPVIFVEHRLLYYTDAFVPEEPFEVLFGKARVCTQGDDITIVGISNMLVECLRAHEILSDIGIQAEVIDPISLVPLDTDTIVQSVRRTGRLLVVDNAWTSCGASAEIVDRVVEQAQNGKHIQVRRMGYAPTTCPTTPVLEQEFYPDPAKIAQAVHSMVMPGYTGWKPDPERAKLAYQVKFRGPF